MQTGGAVGGCCHVTEMLAGLPTPLEFAAATEYTRATAVASVVVQVLLVAEQPQFGTEPEYLAFHPLLYLLGVGYERMVNRISALAPLRVAIVAVAVKP